jgi:HEAT repeat protein
VSELDDDRLVPQAAFFLGVLVRMVAGAVSYPYRQLRRLTHTDPAEPGQRPPRPAKRALSAGPRRGDRGAVHRDAARLADRQGLASLSAALTDPAPEARIAALETIGSLGGEEVGPMLVDLLHDPDSNVRVAAAAVAGRTRAAEVVFSLILALDDPDQAVREAARRALEAITGERIEFDVTQPSEVRQGRVEDLKRWWKQRRLAELAGSAAERS